MDDVPEGAQRSPVTLSIVPKATLPDSEGEVQPPVVPRATDTEDSMAFLWAAVPIVAINFCTATLDRGRDVLLPIAVAFILAIIFTRLANLLEPLVGRILSAALVVLFALGTITAIGYFLTVELTGVADQVANYSDNIGNKVAALEKTSPPWLQHLKYALANVQRHVQKDNPPAALPRAVEAVPVPPSVLQEVQPILPMLSGVVEALLISVLVFFLLYSRKDLRDRFVRLVARARITIAPQAIETAAQTVGHYLLLFSLINLGFGFFCGLAAWVFGLPNAVLWGLLAFLLRFIPYVGSRDRVVFTCPRGLRRFSGLEPVTGGSGKFHVSGPNRRSVHRTVRDRPWHRCFASSTVDIGDVLVMALGLARVVVGDALNCLPQSCRRFDSGFGFSQCAAWRRP